jgi:hypothetical protein
VLQLNVSLSVKFIIPVPCTFTRDADGCNPGIAILQTGITTKRDVPGARVLKNVGAKCSLLHIILTELNTDRSYFKLEKFCCFTLNQIVI